jgi:5-methylcytosine-specific restriction endonuclease McrA
MKAPAYQMYAADYLADERVMLMTLEEEGQMVRDIRAAAMRGDREFLKQFPFIGRLTMNDDKPQRPPVPAGVRKRVMAAGCCVLCGSAYKLELDHIIPWSKGGTHDEANLQCLCKPCNRKKSNKL